MITQRDMLAAIQLAEDRIVAVKSDMEQSEVEMSALVQRIAGTQRHLDDLRDEMPKLRAFLKKMKKEFVTAPAEEPPGHDAGPTK